MRFDLISIFPEYFRPLELSLLGKASREGKVETVSHDLRQWAEGNHRSVDDTPAGGGAGMVMRPDVWGKALDEILQAPLDLDQPRRVVAIPTPSGVPLTQQTVQSLVTADQIAVVCGRYEGPDARVGEHYRLRGYEVHEFSLGDFVLNGGELAAMALVEAVGRLVDGVVGNPDSLVEESHNDEGLLEYPAYTHPRTWRELPTPEVLAGGNHRAIARWRRTQSLKRTAAIRPDLVEKLDLTRLDATDREVLAACGWLVTPSFQPVSIRVAYEGDADKLAELAARTFPMACPPDVSQEDIVQFVSTNLSSEAFRHYLQSPHSRVCLVEEKNGNPIAYTLVEEKLPAEMTTVPPESAYISKCYADFDYHGSGVSGALMEFAIADAANQWGVTSLALATNYQNKRASKFYKRHNFRAAGRRHFMVGETDNIDTVFVLDLTKRATDFLG